MSSLWHWDINVAPYYTSEDTEAQRSQALCPRSTQLVNRARIGTQISLAPDSTLLNHAPKDILSFYKLKKKKKISSAVFLLFFSVRNYFTLSIETIQGQMYLNSLRSPQIKISSATFIHRYQISSIWKAACIPQIMQFSIWLNIVDGVHEREKASDLSSLCLSFQKYSVIKNNILTTFWKASFSSEALLASSW